jgi:hypothetical protein
MFYIKKLVESMINAHRYFELFTSKEYRFVETNEPAGNHTHTSNGKLADAMRGNQVGNTSTSWRTTTALDGIMSWWTTEAPGGSWSTGARGNNDDIWVIDGITPSTSTAEATTAGTEVLWSQIRDDTNNNDSR